MSGFEIEVKVGYEGGLFFSEIDEFDIANEWDLLSCYPVTIKLLKREGDHFEKVEDCEKQVLATLEGFYFDIEYMENTNIPFFEVFDSIDQSVYELYNVLFDGDDYKEMFDVFNPNLFYLESISVSDEVQNKNYKEMLISNLEEILRYIAKLNVGVIAIETCIVAENVDNKVSDKNILEAKELLDSNGYIIASDDEEYWIKELY